MKPVITDVTPEKIEELKALLNPNNPNKRDYMNRDSTYYKRALIKKYTNGAICGGCDFGIVQKKLTYDISDKDIGACSLVEYYCLRCFNKLVHVSNGKDEFLAQRDNESVLLSKRVRDRK